MEKPLKSVERPEKCGRCRNWSQKQADFFERKGVIDYSAGLVFYCGAMWKARGVFKQVDHDHVCDVGFFEEVQWGDRR